MGCWTGIVIHQVYYSLELFEYTLCDDYYKWFGIEMIEEYRKIAEARTNFILVTASNSRDNATLRLLLKAK